VHIAFLSESAHTRIVWVFGWLALCIFWSPGRLVGIFSHPEINVYYNFMKK